MGSTNVEVNKCCAEQMLGWTSVGLIKCRVEQMSLTIIWLNRCRVNKWRLNQCQVNKSRVGWTKVGGHIWINTLIIIFKCTFNKAHQYLNKKLLYKIMKILILRGIDIWREGHLRIEPFISKPTFKLWNLFNLLPAGSMVFSKYLVSSAVT